MYSLIRIMISIIEIINTATTITTANIKINNNPTFINVVSIYCFIIVMAVTKVVISSHYVPSATTTIQVAVISSHYVTSATTTIQVAVISSHYVTIAISVTKFVLII